MLAKLEFLKKVFVDHFQNVRNMIKKNIVMKICILLSGYLAKLFHCISGEKPGYSCLVNDLISDPDWIPKTFLAKPNSLV